MDPRLSRRRLLRRGALATTVGLAGCVGAIAGPSPEERLADHESDLERLADVATAIDEGYRTTGRFVRTGDGALGIPFVNRQVTEIDPTTPHAVLYELTDDGTYEALGLKWFVPAEDRDGAPSLFGRQFDGPMDGESDAFPRQYALHAWPFRDNPDGVFALYNSAVEPSELVQQVDPVRARLDRYLLGADATDDGYTNTEKCIATSDGGYGVPFVRDDAGAGGGTDPEKPPVLLYRVTSNWVYVLLGAEWYVPTAEADGPPTLFGEQFHDATAGHSPETDQPDHYGLHAWLFRANPRGMFSPFNPTIQC